MAKAVESFNVGLNEENIKKGRLIYYIPSESRPAWSCPAMIIRVNLHQRTFRVRSLDNMTVINREYTFNVDEHSPGSRKSMVTTSADVVKDFFSREEWRLKVEVSVAQDEVSFARERVSKAKATLRRFRKNKKSLPPLK